MIEARPLYSLGIGLTDADLIASVFISMRKRCCGQGTSDSVRPSKVLPYTLVSLKN